MNKKAACLANSSNNLLEIIDLKLHRNAVEKGATALKARPTSAIIITIAQAEPEEILRVSAIR
jgi:hypothetical protein